MFKFSKKAAIRIRRVYPFLMILEMIIVPILLSVESLFSYSLYTVLAVQILITLFVAVFPLYLLKVANARNYAHRGIVILICVVQILILNFKDSKNWSSVGMKTLPLVLLTLLFIGLIVNGGYTIFKSVEFWRSPNLIDPKLMIEQNGKKKPIDTNPLP